MYDRSVPYCKIYQSRSPSSDCNYKQHHHRKYINQFRIHCQHDDHYSLRIFTVRTNSLTYPFHPITSRLYYGKTCWSPGWHYCISSLMGILESKDSSKGNPIILGRPWLATANAFIGCRDGEMTISNGLSTQRLILYPPIEPITNNSWWLNCSFGDEYFYYLSLPSDFSLALQEQTTENVLKPVCLFNNLYGFPSVLCSTRSYFWK